MVINKSGFLVFFVGFSSLRFFNYTENWCVVNNVAYGCHVKHPFYCDKWITCETSPIEQACFEGTHFYFKNDECQGYCDKPEIADCTLGRK